MEEQSRNKSDTVEQTNGERLQVRQAGWLADEMERRGAREMDVCEMEIRASQS